MWISSEEPKSPLTRRLREAMNEQDLTIRDLAGKADISYEHVRKVVNDEAVPSKLALKAICLALNLPVEELQKLAKKQHILKKYGDVLTEMAGKKAGMEPIESVWDDLSSEHRKDLTDMANRWAASDRSSKEAIKKD